MDITMSTFLLFPFLLPFGTFQRLLRSRAAQQRLRQRRVSGSAAPARPRDALPRLATAAALLLGLLCPGHLQLLLALLASVPFPVPLPRLALPLVAVPALLLARPRCLRLLRQQAGLLQLCEHSPASAPGREHNTRCSRHRRFLTYV